MAFQNHFLHISLIACDSKGNIVSTVLPQGPGKSLISQLRSESSEASSARYLVRFGKERALT